MITPDGSTDGVGNLRDAASRRGLRQTHEARAQFLGAAILSSFFVVALGASIFLGAVMVVGTLRESGGGGLMANGRTGRISRPLSDGTLCHYMVFDNKTAQTVEDRIGRCDENKPKPKVEKPAPFTWGSR